MNRLMIEVTESISIARIIIAGYILKLGMLIMPSDYYEKVNKSMLSKIIKAKGIDPEELK